MDALREQWFLNLGDVAHVLRVLVRLLVALFLGTVVGWQREQLGKAAGLRTHMLVSLGSCLFILAPVEAGVKLDQLMRVIQGLATGIGFLGAGTILKHAEERKIQGLTTAASIWVTAAVGMAVGLGYVWPALLAVLLGVVVLQVMSWIEPWIDSQTNTNREK